MNEIDKWIEQIRLHILALIVLTIRITQTTLTPTPTHTHTNIQHKKLKYISDIGSITH